MNGIYDIHTHIIPKVDDGAASINEALKIIQDEIHQGVTGIMLTPHFRLHMFEPTEEEIDRQYQILLQELRQRFPDLTIAFGREFHAVPDLEHFLKKRKIYTLNSTKNLLLEFSGRHTPDFIKENTQKYLQMGYQPIIAHIERYPAVHRNYPLIQSLRDMGAAIQVNADSILGIDEWKSKRFCKALLKKRLVDYVASDVHNMTSRPSHIGACADYIARKYGQEYAQELFIDNPSRLFT